MQSLLASPDLLKIIGIILGAVVPFLARLIWKDRADKAESTFRTGLDLAYHVVNDVSAQTATPIDDKVALGLRYLREWMASQDVKITPDHEEAATLAFMAMHAREKSGLNPSITVGAK